MKCKFNFIFRSILELEIKFIIKNRFHPVNKSLKHKPYEKLLSTQAEFGALDYGTKFFREEPKDQELINGVIINFFKILKYINNSLF